MKANELMIGDWVRAPKNADGDFYAAQVGEIMQGGEHYYCNIPGPDGNDSIRCDDLSPVPLTSEILEKNGWIEAVLRHWNIEEDFATEKGEDGNAFWWRCGTALVCPLNFVHELQNALRVCGIEKEITI